MLNNPCGMAIDISNNLYIGDYQNNKIRLVKYNGIITTYAGTGIKGAAGDGGSATSAQLNSPWGVVLDSR